MLLPYSRVVTVKLDSDDQGGYPREVRRPAGGPGGLGSQGNAQTTGNGDLFVGWGALPYISEFSPSGQLLFNAELPAGVNTYRAYLLPWQPAR